MNNKKQMAVIMAASLATACSGPATLTEEMYEEKVEVVEKQISDVPKWMLNLPTAKDAFYSAGTAVSGDMQIAIDKATINAKRTLADRIGGELSSQMKMFVMESGEQGSTDVVMLNVEQVTKNIIARVNVAGYIPEEVKVTHQGTGYRVYTLLKYPVGEANRLMMMQIKKNNALLAKVRSTKSFKELEEAVELKKIEELKEVEALYMD
jgi:hypothetical protein